MRTGLVLIALWTGGPAWADGNATGFDAGLADCAHAVATGDYGFARAAEITGNAQDGFVVWYHDPSGTPIYGTRLGQDGDVTICAGPPAMGPFSQDFDATAGGSVQTVASDYGLVKLQVPAPGEYYADCNAAAPRLFLALNVDATQRVGFQFIASPDVAQSCKKFGADDAG